MSKVVPTWALTVAALACLSAVAVACTVDPQPAPSTAAAPSESQQPPVSQVARSSVKIETGSGSVESSGQTDNTPTPATAPRPADPERGGQVPGVQTPTGRGGAIPVVPSPSPITIRGITGGSVTPIPFTPVVPPVFSPPPFVPGFQITPTPQPGAGSTPARPPTDVIRRPLPTPDSDETVTKCELAELGPADALLAARVRQIPIPEIDGPALTVWTLPEVNGSPVRAKAMEIDSSGTIWFFSNGNWGCLDTSTRVINLWRLEVREAAAINVRRVLNPFDMIMSSSGVLWATAWYESRTGLPEYAVFRFDPRTGRQEHFSINRFFGKPRHITELPDGSIWVSLTPDSGGQPALYGISADGTSSVLYRVPTRSGIAYAMESSSDGYLWIIHQWDLGLDGYVDILTRFEPPRVDNWASHLTAKTTRWQLSSPQLLARNASAMAVDEDGIVTIAYRGGFDIRGRNLLSPGILAVDPMFGRYQRWDTPLDTDVKEGPWDIDLPRGETDWEPGDTWIAMTTTDGFGAFIDSPTKSPSISGTFISVDLEVVEGETVELPPGVPVETQLVLSTVIAPRVEPLTPRNMGQFFQFSSPTDFRPMGVHLNRNGTVWMYDRAFFLLSNWP